MDAFLLGHGLHLKLNQTIAIRISITKAPKQSNDKSFFLFQDFDNHTCDSLLSKYFDIQNNENRGKQK